MASSSKQPTPDLSHLKWSDFEHLYEPSDDTFLLLDALEKDRSFMEARHPGLCVEVGYVSFTTAAASRVEILANF